MPPVPVAFVVGSTIVRWYITKNRAYCQVLSCSGKELKGMKMKLLSEFKTFAVKGNVVDMAVGVVIGGAFGKITSSLVADVIMPPIGLLLSDMDFSKLVITLKEAVGDTAAVTINYGKFIQNTVDFVIIAVAMFLVVKSMNALKRREEIHPTEPPPPSAEVVILTDIRDILSKGGDK